MCHSSVGNIMEYTMVNVGNMAECTIVPVVNSP